VARADKTTGLRSSQFSCRVVENATSCRSNYTTHILLARKRSAVTERKKAAEVSRQPEKNRPRAFFSIQDKIQLEDQENDRDQKERADQYAHGQFFSVHPLTLSVFSRVR
jgi:hypothetical protein